MDALADTLPDEEDCPSPLPVMAISVTRHEYLQLTKLTSTRCAAWYESQVNEMSTTLRTTASVRSASEKLML